MVSSLDFWEERTEHAQVSGLPMLPLTYTLVLEECERKCQAGLGSPQTLSVSLARHTMGEQTVDATDTSVSWEPGLEKTNKMKPMRAI